MKHIGDKGEVIVSEFFNKNGIDCKKNEDKNTRYDYDLLCKFNDTDFTCEVKYDLMSLKTGNIAIEIWNTKSNMPSGITATKANLWIIVIPQDKVNIFAIKTETLKKYIEDNKPFKTVNFGGDKNAKLLIYKKDDILKIFTQLCEMKKKDLNKWLTQTII